MKQKILIVYQDGCPDLERTARGAKDRLESADRELAMIPASAITIPQVLASTFFVLGADEVGTGSYSELARILGGINLAGRKVAYFGASGAAVAWLRTLALESDLVQVGTDLVGSKPEAASLAAWVRSFS